MYEQAAPNFQGALLSSTPVQQMLGLSRTTVWRLARSGALSTVHFGSALRFRHSDLLALMQLGATRQTPQVRPGWQGCR